MAEIINLRQARKRKARAAAETAAAVNRLAFGQSKVERERLKAQSEQAERHLDGHRRDRAGDGEAADD